MAGKETKQNVFTFVVSGLELSETQRDHISSSIGEAVIGALTSLNLKPGPELYLRPKGVNGGRLLLAVDADRLLNSPTLKEEAAAIGGVREVA